MTYIFYGVHPRPNHLPPTPLRGEEASSVGGPMIGDHGPVNSVYGEKIQSKNLEDVKTKAIVANTTCSPT